MGPPDCLRGERQHLLLPRTSSHEGEPVNSIELKGNPNYAAFIVEVKETRTLDGLDNLVAVNVGGYQALVPKSTRVGDRFIAFVAGTQIAEDYAERNLLTREAGGYLEKNRRVKAIRLRGHASNLLLVHADGFEKVPVGTQFDHWLGKEICRKFVVPVKATNNGSAVVRKTHKSGVTDEQFPEHYDTPQWFRVSDQFYGKDVTVTQKVHGTSIRLGWVEVDVERKWWERLLRFPAQKEWKFVVGSRRVIKTESDGAHWCSTDIWTEYAKTHRLADALPKGVMVYGELIGYAPDGEPIQKGYTYDLAPGQARLLVYRVTVAGADGTHYDLSDAAMREFCDQRGLAVVPLLASFSRDEGDLLKEFLVGLTDTKFCEEEDWAFIERPVPLSPDSPCDEGVVIRAEGITPHVAKFKNPRFYEHESASIDKGEADIEDATS